MYSQNQTLDSCYQAIKKSPDLPLTYQALGKLLLSFGKNSEAIRALQMCIELDSDMGEGHFLLGKALANQGDFHLSFIHYRKALNLQANKGQVLLELAQSLETTDLLDEAIQACKSSPVDTSNDSQDVIELYKVVGSICLRKNKSKDAILAYKKCLLLKPHESSVYYGLSVCLEREDNLEESISCFQKALRLGYKFKQPRFNQGQPINCFGTHRLWKNSKLVSLLVSGSPPDTEHIISKIHSLFNSLNVRSQLISREWWTQIINVWRQLDESRSVTLKYLSGEVKAFPATQFEVYEWIHLYSMCLRLGLFSLAYVFRHKARIRALYLTTFEEVTEQDLRLYITSAIEIQKFDLAQQGLEALKAHHCVTMFYGFNQWLVDLHTHRKPISPISRHYLNASVREDEDFLNFVSNKRLAIVGPLKTEKMNAEEIDSFDAVVRMNYRQAGIGCDSKHKGLRCDLTYFNQEQSDNLLVNHGGELPQSLSWAVLKWGCKSHVFEEIGERNRNLSTRYSKPAHDYSLWFNGHLNLLQLIVLDLMLFEPRKLKVFHADLMLTPGRVKGYYPKEFKRDREREMVRLFIEGSIVHDPVTMYSLLKNLWTARLIEGDAHVSGVMELSCEEYMEKLQTAYTEAYLFRE